MRGSLDRGLHLLPWLHPICKCGHEFVRHLSGDGMNHYARCRVERCNCDSFNSMNNIEYLEYLNDSKHNNKKE